MLGRNVLAAAIFLLLQYYIPVCVEMWMMILWSFSFWPMLVKHLVHDPSLELFLICHTASKVKWENEAV